MLNSSLQETSEGPNYYDDYVQMRVMSEVIMKLSAGIRLLLDAKCSGIKITQTESRHIIEGAYQQQSTTGIAGHEDLKAFAAIKYYVLFESKIRAAHADVLAILDACHMWSPLRCIPSHVDLRLQPFVEDVNRRVVELVGNSPNKPEIKDIPALYASLKSEFEHRAELAIRSKRKDFVLTSVWVPVIGLLLDRIFQLF